MQTRTSEPSFFLGTAAILEARLRLDSKECKHSPPSPTCVCKPRYAWNLSGRGGGCLDRPLPANSEQRGSRASHDGRNSPSGNRETTPTDEAQASLVHDQDTDLQQKHRRAIRRRMATGQAERADGIVGGAGSEERQTTTKAIRAPPPHPSTPLTPYPPSGHLFVSARRLKFRSYFSMNFVWLFS